MLAPQQVISRLDTIPAVNFVRDLAERESVEVYLVGEPLRDLFLGKTPSMYFFAVTGNPSDLARKLAELVPGEVMEFNFEADQGSIFRGDCGHLKFQSLNRMRPDQFMEREVEFTVNSLVLDLRRQQIIDSHSAVADIREKVINLIAPLPKMKHGPGVLLRAVRHAQLDATFTLSPQTHSDIKNHRKLLQGADPTLVGRELSHLLISEEYVKGIGLLYELGLADEVFKTFLPCALASDGRGPESVGFSAGKVISMCRIVGHLAHGLDTFLLKQTNLLRHVALITPLVRQHLMPLNFEEKRRFLFEWGSQVERQLVALAYPPLFAFRARVVAVGYLANAVPPLGRNAGTAQLEDSVRRVLTDFGKRKGLLCAIFICADFLRAVEGAEPDYSALGTAQKILQSSVRSPIDMQGRVPATV
jgi:hypothetical protein